MNKQIRNFGMGIMCIAIVLAILFGGENANSYADEVDNHTDEIKQASEAFEKMNKSSQQQFKSGIENGLGLDGLDLETALMLVQTQRTQLLDRQLKDQLEEVQRRNTQTAELNSEINNVRVELKELRNAEEPLEEEQLQRIEELEGTLIELEDQRDSFSNSQQLDMLRLQALSNKRNEAFDVMTNFVKKMQDSRSSIISNMR